MARRILTVSLSLGLGLALILGGFAPALRSQAADPAIEQKVDAIFSEWNSRTTPGCAVGVSVAGTIVLEKAYGLADLEREVPNTPNTIFEAGSVSKQFTAAAVLLLTRDGKVSLDDLARTYLPELPDYGSPLTIRHMLQHTSGLRDWGSLASLAGWERTTREHTHAHVLDIASRQRALNFTPGTDWSYSNTGYNLAAILVSRVASEPFAEFTRRRIFEPLRMTRTSWRDNHRRLVKGRAVAYAPTRGGFEILMPFENVHGNGGLLTTVGDLLRWNENFVNPRVGDPEFVEEQERPGRLADGREHEYGLGLFIGSYKGTREISHSGSTAGYTAFLARYPDPHLSVGVLCNVAGAAAGRYTSEVADLFLADRIKPTLTAEPVTLTAAELDAKIGMYRSGRTGEALQLIRDGSRLRVENGPVLAALSRSRFRMGNNGPLLEFNGAAEDRTLALQLMGREREVFIRVAPVQPTPDHLNQFVGSYVSNEVETALTLVVEEGVLKMKQRPDVVLPLKPLYADAFASPPRTIRFHRDATGHVIGLSVGMPRAWDVRFDRVKAGR